jgi:hypothetical protein
MNSDRRGFFGRLLGLGAMVIAPKVIDLPAAPVAPAATQQAIQMFYYVPNQTYTWNTATTSSNCVTIEVK